MRSEMTDMACKRGGRRGFTLIEAIVIIVILGVIAAVIAPRLLGRVGQGKQAVATSNAASLANSIKLFHTDCARFPDSVDELFTRPGDLAEGTWKGPYVNSQKELLDPWGNKFVIQVPGQEHVDFDVISYGKDGQPGGTDEDKDVVGG